MEACSRWKRLIMVNSMQANEAPQERMSAAWRLHKEGMSLVEGRLWSKLLMLPRPTVSDARHYIWTYLQAALASELAWS